MRVKVRLEHILYNAKEKRSEAVSNRGQFSDLQRRDLGNVLMWLFCKVKEKCLPEACSRLYSQSAFKVYTLFRGQAVLLLYISSKGRYLWGFRGMELGVQNEREVC